MEEQQIERIEPTEPQTEPHGDGTDWKAECRKWEKRAKENDRAAKELAEIREQQMSDLEKALKRAENAEAALQAREAADARAAMVRDVMEKHRVDPKYADLLTAEDEAGLIEQAKLIGERFADPVPTDTGAQPAHGDGEEQQMREFAHSFFGN